MNAAPILIVDDDETLSRVLRRVLIRDGYEVNEAGSVAQALEAARSLKPQLGLLDLSLPDGDGVELARRLRAEGVDCPFILITAYPLRLRDQPQLGGAFARVLTKPLNLEELRQAIDAALHAPAPAPLRPSRRPYRRPLAPQPGAPQPSPTAVAPVPAGRLRGVVMGGVIVAGLLFFCVLVVFPRSACPASPTGSASLPCPPLSQRTRAARPAPWSRATSTAFAWRPRWPRASASKRI